MSEQNILEVRNLTKHLKQAAGRWCMPWTM